MMITEMYKAWSSMLKASRICEILEGGNRAVYMLMGEILDGWLRSTVPAYAAVVAIYEHAESIAEAAGQADRLPALEEVRADIVHQIAYTTGLDYLVREVLRNWQSIPAPIRQAACGGLADALAEIEAQLELARDVSDIFEGDVGPISDKILSGEIIPVATASISSGLLAPTATQIANRLLHEAGIDTPIADGIEAVVESGLRDVLQPISIVPGADGVLQFVSTATGALIQPVRAYEAVLTTAYDAADWVGDRVDEAWDALGL